MHVRLKTSRNPGKHVPRTSDILKFVFRGVVYEPIKPNKENLHQPESKELINLYRTYKNMKTH